MQPTFEIATELVRRTFATNHRNGSKYAWAAANLGASAALLTLACAKIGVMSCNPAIGGLAKGQIVREIDALGGLMAVATDRAGTLPTPILITVPTLTGGTLRPMTCVRKARLPVGYNAGHRSRAC